MSHRVKFAITGLGNIGKRHAQVVWQNEECELVAVIDRENTTNEFNVPHFNSLKDFFNANIEVDVVTIATPNGIHAEQGLEVLSHNKHVLIEKPIALKVADAEMLIQKSLEMDRKVFTVMQNRYAPASKWLKELIESGVLGKIFIVQVNCFWNRDNRYYTKSSWHGSKKLDGGTLFTQFSHFVDILYWLFGDIKNIKAKFADFNHESLTEFEDSGFINFDFVNGGVGSLNYSTSVWNKNLESSLTVIAENGTLKVAGQYMDKVEYCNIKDYEIPALEETTIADKKQNHSYVIANVVDVLNGRAECTSTVEQGLEVVRIISDIYSAG